jgi:hypothetical protein
VEGPGRPDKEESGAQVQEITGQTRREALADLLLEALGTDTFEPNGGEEVSDEREDHA